MGDCNNVDMITDPSFDISATQKLELNKDQTQEMMTDRAV